MHFFKHNGVELAYIDVPAASQTSQGTCKNKTIILVHGFASHHAVNWVNTLWVKTLTHAGFRVVALDHRGHGQSQKLYDPEAYGAQIMAQDVRALMDHLDIERAAIMGYSMGARVTAHMALSHPERLSSALLGGLGIKLVEGAALPQNIAEAMEAPSLADLHEPVQKLFRAFAESTHCDLRALAACIRGSRQSLTPDQVSKITVPTLISVGTNDPIAGSSHALASLIPNAKAFDIVGKDHNLAVGDRSHKEEVLKFLSAR
jgi:pimeloyl-ACP methyl ester carboxylesterase